ncbi:DEAD/DEAH box helicase [Salinibacillus xinjiangensis]|uniref:DEAD/DEAH box helicase n=1 Tax=Salinibacillus xinjiangensis TaxID=1229268 RepID=A0A6G1X4D1_9BACI|nr:DEAD/DEAH box helicase [Salinibacillus xinjiangensis]MRG85853.1 DEAD/DEAH box helicase [Salinibacillus xinjiangensis]
MNSTEEFVQHFKPFIQTAWEKAGFEQPTAIQQQAVPHILQGEDIIAESPTGTGKTLAYLLPIMEKVDTKLPHIQAVILASSHELVMQIHQEIQNWGSGEGIKSAAFIGGANIKRQIDKLKKRPQIVVATPGRLLELIKIKKAKMHEVKTIVLDEADQLFVPEHISTIEQIIKSTLADRQVLVFSATVPSDAEKTAKEFMNEPELIRIKQDDTKPVSDHGFVVCQSREKVEMLRRIAFLENVKGIAFMNDIGNLDVYAQKLQYKGVPIGVLHGEVKKQERAKMIKDFRAGNIPLLLTTDVAARGLDVKGITHVVHVDLPKDTKQYIHRSGRTGRLGSTSGMVLSLVNDREVRKLKQLIRNEGIPVHEKKVKGGKVMDIKK